MGGSPEDYWEVRCLITGDNHVNSHNPSTYLFALEASNPNSEYLYLVDISLGPCVT